MKQTDERCNTLLKASAIVNLKYVAAVQSDPTFEPLPNIVCRFAAAANKSFGKDAIRGSDVDHENLTRQLSCLVNDCS